MSNANAKTLESYNAQAQVYVDGTSQVASGEVAAFIDAALDGLPVDARILEIGSAFGRDAAYMRAKGYSPHCTDAADAFVVMLQERGFDARLFNVLRDDFKDTYDLVFANAVFLHFTRDEFTQTVLPKMYTALTPRGRVAFSVKEGEGEEWSDAKLGAPRFFCYWTAPDLQTVLTAAGFKDIQIARSQDTSNSNHIWLRVIARG